MPLKALFLVIFSLTFSIQVFIAYYTLMVVLAFSVKTV